MTKAPSDLQDLRRRIYRKAKSDKTHRFWGLFVHIAKVQTLEEAYRIAKKNGGAPGIDGEWRISRNGPTRFPLIGPTLDGLPAEPQATSFTRPFCAKQVSSP